MKNFEKLLWFFPKSVFFESFRSKEVKKAFESEINFINFIRLRVLSVITFFVILLMIILDFNSEMVWDEQTLFRFKTLDFSLLFYLIVILYIEFFHGPKTKNEINKIHILTIRTSLFFLIIWSALVSAYEWPSSQGMPTFLVGTFTVCTFFINQGPFILLVLFTGISTLLIGLLFLNISFIELIRQYFATVFLVVIAYSISRILMSYSIKTFISKTNLENTNLTLDAQVKERTKELMETNSKLRNEIAEREKYEIQLQKEKQRAEESDRLKTSFLANMSHEIRTPLNGIVGFSDLMLTTELDESKKQKFLNLITKKSHQLLKIIDDIIDISLIDSNQLKLRYSPTKIEQIIDSAIAVYHSLEHLYESKTIEFEFVNQLPQCDMEISTDMLRLQQVFHNIFDNALKFTDHGKIKFLSRLDDNEVFFSVEDTGIGINNTKSEIIFERFIQADSSKNRAFGGTGLGLSISSGILNALYGSIWLDNSYENGARFCFTVPLKKPFKNDIAIGNLKIDERILINKKILLSFQNNNQLQIIRKLFENIHLESTTMLTDKNISDYDIIITEIDNYEFYGEKMFTEINSCGIFAITKNNIEPILYRGKGIVKTYKTPVNLHQMAKDIISFLSHSEQVS